MNKNKLFLIISIICFCIYSIMIVYINNSFVSFFGMLSFFGIIYFGIKTYKTSKEKEKEQNKKTKYTINHYKQDTKEVFSFEPTTPTFERDEIDEMTDEELSKIGFITYDDWKNGLIKLEDEKVIYNGTNISTAINDNDRILKKENALNKEYSQILSSHYNYIEKIKNAYAIAKSNNQEMENVISLCLSDIELAPAFSEYCKKIAKLYGQNEYITNYPSFSRLAIIYEKQKEYSKAIETCKRAIELGFYKDNTTGQMYGRLARLMNKLNQENNGKK